MKGKRSQRVCDLLVNVENKRQRKSVTKDGAFKKCMKVSESDFCGRTQRPILHRSTVVVRVTAHMQADKAEMSVQRCTAHLTKTASELVCLSPGPWSEGKDSACLPGEAARPSFIFY